MSIVDYLIQPGEITPEAADRKRKLAMLLQQKGSDTSPVQHWTQGAARLSDALFGALDEARVDRSEAAAKASAGESEKALYGLLGGGGAAPAPAPATGGVAGALGGFDDAVNKVLKYEGGYTVDNGGPTNFGISSRANPDVDVKSLTPDKAKALYKTRYWDAIGGDQLAAQDPRLALVAFDTAVNAGPGTAQKLLAQSGGDPQKMLALRQQYNTGLIERDPSQYGKYADGWNNRLADLGRTIGSQGASADMPAPGVQPAEYQIPGQQPQQAPQGFGGGSQSVAAQQAIRLINNPYTSPAAKMIAQQVLARAMKGVDPKEQLEIQKLTNENKLFPLQEQKLQQDLQGGAPIDIESKRAGINKSQAELGQVGKTGDINEYEYAKSSGAFTGTFPEYQKMIAEAKRSQVNIDQRAENAEEMARGSGMGKRLNEIADEGGKAQEDAVMFQRFGQLLGNVQTGGKTALLEGIRQMTGGQIVLDPNVDNVQALNAAVQYLAPRLRVPGTGAQSDAELRNFMNSVPTLAGQPGGNKIILDSLQGLVQYKLQRAEIAQAWQSGEISGKEATKRIQSLPSPFANLPKVEEKKAPGAVPQGVDPEVWKFMTPEEKALWN